MRLQLGSLFVNNKKVWIDENSYFEISKDDDSADLDCCNKKWKEGHVKHVKKSEKHEDDENTAPVPTNVTATNHNETKKKETN